MIVDANVAGELLSKSADAVPVLKWLLKGRGALVVGGKLTSELARTGLRKTLVELDRAGRLRKQDDAKLETAASQIDESLCRSNDLHVIAVAMTSGCRLVFTRDKNLQTDMKNRKIISPGASIYTSQTHHHLLQPCECK